MGLKMFLFLLPNGNWCDREADMSLNAWSRLEVGLAQLLVVAPFIKTSMAVVVKVKKVNFESMV